MVTFDEILKYVEFAEKIPCNTRISHTQDQLEFILDVSFDGKFHKKYLEYYCKVDFAILDDVLQHNIFGEKICVANQYSNGKICVDIHLDWGNGSVTLFNKEVNQDELDHLKQYFPKKNYLMENTLDTPIRIMRKIEMKG